MVKNKIGWCDITLNPVFGCNNGCKYCYARKLSFRFAKEFGKIHGLDPDVFRNFDPVWLEKNFNRKIPKSATHIFVNSMSDVAFWKEEWKERVFEKIEKYPDKKFLFLTKNRRLMNDSSTPNVFLGFTIENQAQLEFCTGADFYSIEPIQEKINLGSVIKSKSSIYCPKQIIVGAETGNRKGKIIPKAEWIEEISKFCQKNGIKLFEKGSLRDIVKRDLIQERI